MRFLPVHCVAIAGLLGAGSACADGDGLATSADRVPWPRFEGRIVSAAPAPAWRADLAPFEQTGLQVRRVGVLGDMYFGSSGSGSKTESSGFRATSGLIVGSRSALLGSLPVSSTGGLAAFDRRLFGTPGSSLGGLGDGGSENTTVPYLGVGYTSLSAKSGWSFRADLGVISLSPGGAAGLGRVVGGSQSLDEVVRDMRLAPIFQLGVSYSF